MKNFFKMATLLVAVLFMVGCDSEDDTIPTPDGPTVSVVASPDSFESGDTLALGESITLTGLSDGGAAIASYAVNRDGTDLGSASVTTTITGFTIPVKPVVTNNSASDSLRGKVNIYNFMTTDVNGKSGNKDFRVYFADSAALSVASSFQWVRCGSGASTSPDLAKFGLAWTSNTNPTNPSPTNPVRAIIKSNSTTKLVVITSAKFSEITTKERLKELIDAGTDVDDYRKVDGFATRTYNDVLGTKVGDEYFLLNVTKGTVSTPTCGTNIVIDGMFKN